MEIFKILCKANSRVCSILWSWFLRITYFLLLYFLKKLVYSQVSIQRAASLTTYVVKRAARLIET